MTHHSFLGPIGGPEIIMILLVIGIPVVIVVVVLLAIGCGYAALAAWAREFFVSPPAIRRLNRTASVIMASAAAFVAARG